MRIRPAATLMLVRERAPGFEIFMLRRSAQSAFLPEMFVFPGGALDEEDAQIARERSLRNAEPPIAQREASDPAFEVAAIREAFEEAGILLAADANGASLRLDPEIVRGARAALHAGTTTFAEMLERFDASVDARRLTHFSHWITPPTEPRRFDTHFYLAVAPRDQVGSSDEIETHQALWIAPDEALRRHAAQSFPMIFPTITHLRRLAAYPTIDELRCYAAAKPIAAVLPIVSDDRRFAIPPELEERW